MENVIIPDELKAWIEDFKAAMRKVPVTEFSKPIAEEIPIQVKPVIPTGKSISVRPAQVGGLGISGNWVYPPSAQV